MIFASASPSAASALPSFRDRADGTIGILAGVAACSVKVPLGPRHRMAAYGNAKGIDANHSHAPLSHVFL